MSDTKAANVRDVESTPRADEFTATKSGFWTRKRKIICGSIVGVIVLFLVIFLPILWLVIVPDIAQKTIDQSVLTFTEASITNPQNTTFDLALKVDVTNAGHVEATLTHSTPLEVYWLVPEALGGGEKPLLRMGLGSFKVSDEKGFIDQKADNVEVLDQKLLAMFNKVLIASPKIQWRLVGDMKVKALGRTYHGLKMNKVVDVLGMSGLKGTLIKEFELQGLPNATGITPITMTATLFNKSPVGIELDTTVFNVTLPLPNNITLPIGTATSVGKTMVEATPKTSSMKLDAKLFPIANYPAEIQATLAQVLGGTKNAHLVVTPLTIGGNNAVSWVQGGLAGLPLEVTLGKAPEEAKAAK